MRIALVITGIHFDRKGILFGCKGPFWKSQGTKNGVADDSTYNQPVRVEDD
jgi:hypothetical protein